MRKIGVLLLLYGSLCSISVAQNNVIKTDLIRPLRGQYSLTYERKLGSFLSVQLGVEAGDYATTSLNGSTDYKLSGFGIIPEVRWYPFNKRRGAPLGFFAGVAFRYASLKEEYYADPFSRTFKDTNEGNVFNYGLDAGYKFRARRIAIEILGGLGSGTLRNFDAFKSARIPYSHLHEDEKRFYRIELSVGYLFPSFKSSL